MKIYLYAEDEVGITQSTEAPTKEDIAKVEDHLLDIFMFEDNMYMQMCREPEPDGTHHWEEVEWR